MSKMSRASGASRVIENREKDQLADDVMDLVLESVQGRGDTTCLSQERLEQDRREEKAFLVAMAVQLRDRLSSQGIKLVKISADGIGEGYVVLAKDSSGRPFRVDALFDDMTPIITGRSRDEQVRRIIDYVTNKILKARETYFARMAGTGKEN